MARELRRISAPGALLLLTVEGTTSWNRCCTNHGLDDPLFRRWKKEIESRGIVFIRDDTFVGSTHPGFYHSTFHAPWYIFEHAELRAELDAQRHGRDGGRFD